MLTGKCFSDATLPKRPSTNQSYYKSTTQPFVLCRQDGQVGGAGLASEEGRAMASWSILLVLRAQGQRIQKRKPRRVASWTRCRATVSFVCLTTSAVAGDPLGERRARHETLMCTCLYNFAIYFLLIRFLMVCVVVAILYALSAYIPPSQIRKKSVSDFQASRDCPATLRRARRRGTIRAWLHLSKVLTSYG